MVDVVYGEVEVPAGVDWKAALRQRAISMRQALLRHPWAVGLMEPRSPGPANLWYHNAAMACLCTDAGLPLRMAIAAYSLMDSYIYGLALQEKTLPSDIPAEAETRRKDLTSADASQAKEFPYLIDSHRRRRGAQGGYDYTAQFDQGLELILDGVEQLAER